MKFILVIAIFSLVLRDVPKYKLVNFHFSECQDVYAPSSIDLMKKRSNKIVVHLRATGSCLGQFKALAEELKNDTLNFIIKCERKIVKTKGHKLEIEGTTCNCVYDYYFDIRTTRALAKDKILFNRKTLKQLDIKGVGYEDDPTKF